jgi:hypothetical protein
MAASELIRIIKDLSYEQTRDALAYKKVRDFLVDHFSYIKTELENEIDYGGFLIIITSNPNEHDGVMFLFNNIDLLNLLNFDITVSFAGVKLKIYSKILQNNKKITLEIAIESTYEFIKDNTIHSAWGYYGFPHIYLDHASIPASINETLYIDNGVCRVRSSGNLFTDDFVDVVLDKYIKLFQFSFNTFWEYYKGKDLTEEYMKLRDFGR